MKKKLLIFHPTIAPYRIDFFNSLCKAFSTEVCLEYWNLKDQKFDYRKIYEQFKFDPKYLPNRSLIGMVKFVKEEITKFKPDIVLVSEFHYITIIVVLLRLISHLKYKIVSICDDSYNMVAENNDFSITHRMARKFVVPYLDDLILVEPRTVEWYQRNYRKGIYFPIIKEDSQARSTYKKVLPLSRNLMKEFGLQGKYVFLFVGRLVSLKNVKAIITAFSKLDQNENALVIVGDGPEKEQLTKLASDLGITVVFTGRLEGDSLYAWYNVANCFVLASYQEPFGAVTNEALLAGCWCIISNKAGSQCLIEDGKNGFTFAPMNVIELTEKMKLAVGKYQYKDCDNVKDNLMLVTYDQCLHDLQNALNRA